MSANDDRMKLLGEERDRLRDKLDRLLAAVTRCCLDCRLQVWAELEKSPATPSSEPRTEAVPWDTETVAYNQRDMVKQELK